jgi:N-acetylneuraminic acid mutarotase
MYILGGWDGERLSDFFQLCLKTWSWTKLKSLRPLSAHSLSPVSPDKLIVVGGASKGGYFSKDIWLYDLTNSNWSKHQDLPEEFHEGEDGVIGHETVSIRSGAGPVTDLVILGGYIDVAWKKHPRHVLKLSLRE